MGKDSVLVGDVGGTSVRLATACRESGRVIIRDFSKRPGRDFDSLESAMADYMKAARPGPEYALLALAGPVIDDRTRLVNHPSWPEIDARVLAQRFGLTAVRLVNDFAAMARSVPELAPGDLEPIHAGTPVRNAPILVAGPGTGFGAATLMPEKDGGWRVISGEGGHASYAPQTGHECDLAARLRTDHAHVSNELVCSGSGLSAVHRALCQIQGRDYIPMKPDMILKLAGSGDALCLDICRIRARAVMGAAADMALANGTTGGVVLAGGVAQRLVKYLREPDALARFLNRGPRTDYMHAMPVSLIEGEMAPLIGAALLHFENGYVT